MFVFQISSIQREKIPDKPPPPYTPPATPPPPSDPPRSPRALPPPKVEPPILVPSTKEKLPKVVHVIAEKLISARADADSVILDKPLEDELMRITADKGTDTENANSRLIFIRFVFDLVKDIVKDIFKVESETQNPPWLIQKPLTKNMLTLAKNESSLVEMVKKEVLVAFNHEKRSQQENMIIRWSQKKRDRVDQVLVRELHAEESSWTNYDDDEAQVKCELSNMIMESLIADTVMAFKKAMNKS